MSTMSTDKTTKMVRVYNKNMRELWDHVNFEHKTLADVIAFLINVEKETRELRQSLVNVEGKRLASEHLAELV